MSSLRFKIIHRISFSPCYPLCEDLGAGTKSKLCRPFQHYLFCICRCLMPSPLLAFSTRLRRQGGMRAEEGGTAQYKRGEGGALPKGGGGKSRSEKEREREREMWEKAVKK